MLKSSYKQMQYNLEFLNRLENQHKHLASLVRTLICTYYFEGIYVSAHLWLHTNDCALMTAHEWLRTNDYALMTTH